MADIVKIQFNVQASDSNWQFSGVTLAPTETAVISASGSWGVIDPPKRGYSGPKGYGVVASGNFRKPGAFEGCLLMQIGSGDVIAFSRDDETFTIHTPGRISFVANDGGDPRYPSHKGYSNNVGFLTVTIEISK